MGAGPVRALRALGHALSFALAACATYGSHLSATPTPVGKRELSLNADGLVIDRGFGAQVLSNPELGWRTGLGPNLDVGGRLNLGGVEANARWRVASAPAFDVAVVPGLALGFVPVTNADTGVIQANALGSVLFGAKLAPRAQLVLGARGIATVAMPATLVRGDASETKLVLQPGGVLGVRAPVGATTFFFPEINVFAPYDTRRAAWFSPTVQGGLAVQFE